MKEARRSKAKHIMKEWRLIPEGSAEGRRRNTKWKNRERKNTTAQRLPVCEKHRIGAEWKNGLDSCMKEWRNTAGFLFPIFLSLGLTFK